MKFGDVSVASSNNTLNAAHAGKYFVDSRTIGVFDALGKGEYPDHTRSKRDVGLRQAGIRSRLGDPAACADGDILLSSNFKRDGRA